MAVNAPQRQDIDHGLLVSEDIAPQVRFGARQLIAYHRAGAPVDISSWGSADMVYEEVSSFLMSYGLQQGMAQDMTHALVEYALDHASEFRSEHKANIIAVRLAVSESNPDPQFETGPVATFRLSGTARQAEMASASGQNVRATISGTATTSSDRSSVENVFQGVREWSVWGKMEAPDKSELEEKAPGLITAALAQIAAGDLSPAEAAALQSQLEALAREGIIPPELADIVRAVETMRVMLDGGMGIDASMAQPQALAEYIAALIEQGLDNGNLPPELARQIMESIAVFFEAHGLDQVMSAEMMQSLSAAIEWAAVTQALEQIMPHLNAADRAIIDAILENGEVPSAELLAEQLAVISDIIAQADLPDAAAPHIAAIEGSMVVLQDIAQNQIEAAAGMGAPAMTDASIDPAALTVTELQQILAVLNEIDPEGLTSRQTQMIVSLQEAAGALDPASMTPAMLETVLNGAGDPAASTVVQAMAAVFSQPDMVDFLPPDIQTSMAALVAAEGGGAMNMSVAEAAPHPETDITADNGPDMIFPAQAGIIPAGPVHLPDGGDVPAPAKESVSTPMPSLVGNSHPDTEPHNSPPSNEGKEPDVILPPGNNPGEDKAPDAAPDNMPAGGNGSGFEKPAALEDCCEECKRGFNAAGMPPEEVERRAYLVAEQTMAELGELRDGERHVTKTGLEIAREGDELVLSDRDGRKIYSGSPEAFKRELATSIQKIKEFEAIVDQDDQPAVSVLPEKLDFSAWSDGARNLFENFNRQQPGFAASAQDTIPDRSVFAGGWDSFTMK